MYRVRRVPSLNGCLFKGSNLIEQVPAIILIFQEKAAGVTADVRQHFSNLKSQEWTTIFYNFCGGRILKKFKLYNRVIFEVTYNTFLLGQS